MNLMFKEQKQSTYNSQNLIDSLMPWFYYKKVDNHEERMTTAEQKIAAFESEMKNLYEDAARFRSLMTNDNQFLPYKQSVRSDDNIKHRMEDNLTEQKLESIVLELKEVEDLKLQVQIVGELVDEIKDILKDVPKQKNNNRRQVLLMFHEALKQNYTKKLFSEKQVKAFIEVARVCNEKFVTKEQYWKMDDILCECNLDMIPDLE